MDNDRPAEPTPRARPLARGVLFFRWVWLVWMATLALSAAESLRYPLVAWFSLGLAGAWTTWLTVTAARWGRTVLAADLVLCGWLVIASGLVVPPGAVVSGRPFFATGYPMSAALLWGVELGPAGGAFAGALLAAAHLASRPLNEVPLTSLDRSQLQNLAGAMINYLVAGVAVGLVSRLLLRSREAVERATHELVRERERAARLAERERLARQIHDSVLQALTLVHKRGRELAAKEPVPATEVRRLAEIAAEQERELRSVILRPAEDVPPGEVALRDELERAARTVTTPAVTVSAVGPLWMPRSAAVEIAAAVRQALENVSRHAEASRATVFAEQDGSSVVVSVRDDGRGFTYDERRLRDAGKVGMLKSMQGRIEDLGGTMTVSTAPERGTEIEFKVPLDQEANRE